MESYRLQATGYELNHQQEQPVIDMARLGIRWTIGDVSDRGFEALRLAIWGAYRVFGPGACYTVCVNTIGVDRARRLVGDVPDAVRWHRSTLDQIPDFVARHLDDRQAEGVGWKLAPLRVYPDDMFSLDMDNDCILWDMPEAVRYWLEAEDPRCGVIAEDVARHHGQFTAQGPEGARNAGIRGISPGFDYAGALRALLEENPVTLASETDEQGLQVAAVSRLPDHRVVRLDEVSICGPLPPHLQSLGSCGAHFVGLNARRLPWDYLGRNASEWIAENWRRHRPALYRAVGVEMAGERAA